MYKRKKKKMGQLFLIALIGITAVFCLWKENSYHEKSLLAVLVDGAIGEIITGVDRQFVPQIFYILEGEKEDEKKTTVLDVFTRSVDGIFPLYGYISDTKSYETQVESKLSYETIIALEAADEYDVAGNDNKNVKEEDVVVQDTENTMEDDQNVEMEQESSEAQLNSIDSGCESTVETMQNMENNQSTGDFYINSAVSVDYPLEKLNDFDYLIHNFYVVDKTTTITSGELSAEKLMSQNMKLQPATGQPQILIYHTHSQEGYVDSIPGNSSTTVVGVGEYLSQILRDRYGFQVMHHVGEYDVESRDHAYANAGPALEQILTENPSIEVVIDLHRDGVADTTRLVTDVNGRHMASIMFFNGLSRTTSTGDIAYLYNPNLETNLAFSFQMQLTANQYYPGLSRHIYLKGYRYNMHYCPKTLLVEVGAQTNTVEEAMNAMEPLADVLAKVVGN